MNLRSRLGLVYYTYINIYMIHFLYSCIYHIGTNVVDPILNCVNEFEIKIGFGLFVSTYVQKKAIDRVTK